MITIKSLTKKKNSLTDFELGRGIKKKNQIKPVLSRLRKSRVNLYFILFYFFLMLFS